MIMSNYNTYNHLFSSDQPFNPKMRIHPTGYTEMWLETIPIYSEGSNICEATSVLAERLLEYANLWKKELRDLPEHNKNKELVERVLSCDDIREIKLMLYIC